MPSAAAGSHRCWPTPARPRAQLINLIEFTFEKLLDQDEFIDIISTRKCLCSSLSGIFRSFGCLTEADIRSFDFIGPALNLIVMQLAKLKGIHRKMSPRTQPQEKKPAGSEPLAQGQLQQQPPAEELLIKKGEEEKPINMDKPILSFGLFYEQLCSVVEQDAEEAFDGLFVLASKALVRTQRLLQDKEIKQIPAWFRCIVAIIRIKSANLSLTAIQTLIKIMVKADKDVIYARLCALIIEEAKPKGVQSSGSGQQLAVSQGASGKSDDFIAVALQRLWLMLDYQHFHQKIVDLIINLCKFFPLNLQEVVVNSFNTDSISDKELAIRRFAIFWKLTQSHYSKEQLQDLNKVGLFIMLDLLDHENPLIRHASKNWLIESIGQFQRVVDPLFEVLLASKNCSYVTDQQQIVYTKIYETRRTNETFKKLKGILLVAPDVFLKSTGGIELSQYIHDQTANFTDRKVSFLFQPLPGKAAQSVVASEAAGKLPAQPAQSQSHNANHGPNQLVLEENLAAEEPGSVEAGDARTLTYLDLLVLLCLRYIQGIALESMSARFSQENAAVNASACEFLELLISHIENKRVSLNLCSFVIEPMLKVLSHAITNQNYVMQIQTLHLLDIILFHSQFAEKSSTELKSRTLTQLLSSKIFMPNLIKGISTDIAYVRQQFISFISNCIPILDAYLAHPNLTNSIKSLMFAYYNIIRSLMGRPAGRDEKKAHFPRKMTASSDAADATRKGGKARLQSDFQSQERYYEIFVILEGLSKILSHFLKLKSLDELEAIQTRINQSIMSQIANTLTLGLFVTESKGIDAQKFEKHHETCECILYDIKQVVDVFAQCWQLSECFEVYTQEAVSSMGVRPYSFDRFNAFNKQLEQLIIEAEIHISHQKSSVRRVIIQIMKPLILQYPKEAINAVLQVWFSMCASQLPAGVQEFQYQRGMIRVIEMLVVINVNVEFVLQAVFESFCVERLQQIYQKKNIKDKKNQVYLNFEAGSLEARLLFFLYAYLSMLYVDSSSLKKEHLNNFWHQNLKILKVLSLSKNPSTNLWLLDFLHMLSQKYVPKDILRESKFKKDLHEIITDKLLFCSNLAAKNYAVFFNDQLNQQQAQNKVAASELQLSAFPQYRLMVPFSPHFYALILGYNQWLYQQQANPHLQVHYVPSEIELTMFGNINSVDEDDLYAKNRIITLKTLKAVGLEILQNCYQTDKQEKVIQLCKTFLDPLFPIFENKSFHNQIYYECSLDLIYAVFAQAPQLYTKEFKKNILEIFNKDDFFSCNKQILRYWSKIINWIEEDPQNDLFSEYLSKVTLSSSFFSKEHTENKRRIKSFNRICFIIYSGSKDFYTKKLHQLIDKISEVIKNAETAHPSLLVLILFCIRVLILRLSSKNLEELFSKIWPMLLTLLLQIFSPQRVGQKQEIKNTNLLVAGLKLIELMSVAQIDEFYMHQWMFIFDYFGLKIENARTNAQQTDAQQQLALSPHAAEQVRMTPFQYQPCIINCLPSQEFKIQYVNFQYADEVQTTYKKKQRKLIMVQSKFEDEMQLKTQALYLCQYMISNNEYRCDVEESQIESLIEDEFLAMDEFILKL